MVSKLSHSPLTVAQIQLLLDADSRGAFNTLEFRDLDVGHLVLLLMHTGMHPSIVADLVGHQVRLDGGSDLIWRRPKTGAFVRVPLPPDICRWAGEFITETPRLGIRTVHRAVKNAGAVAGIPELCPRTLRHTFLWMVARTSRSINEVMRLGACSLGIAAEYIRAVDTEFDAKLRGSSIYGPRTPKIVPLGNFDEGP